MWTAIKLAFALVLVPFMAQAAGCEDVVFEEFSFTVCRAVPGEDRIALALRNEDGETIGSFSRLEQTVKKPLAFAMNAGMYHADRRPVGLYVEGGDEVAPIVTREGPGNFGLLPNGVLCVTEYAAEVVESRAFAAAPRDCRFATQSGPMLVINAALHPRFLERSDSRHIRNGVGVGADGVFYAVISNRAVNFHTFGRFFRDVLETPNALFLDGKVSRLHVPALARSDIGLPLGPMLYVVAGAD